MNISNPKLSLIIPVYNAESFITENIQTIVSFFGNQLSEIEIIMIDDGSTDKTCEKIYPFICPNIHLIRLEKNKGKFAALKAGIESARGSCCIFTDADLPYDMEAFHYIESLVNNRGMHIVVGDRSLPESGSLVKSSIIRRCATLIFTFSVRMLVTGGLFDTQCGLKGFRKDIAKPLFSLVQDLSFSGDVELLYIALKYNLEIKRIPVKLKKQGLTTIRLFSDSIGMFFSIMKLKINWINGKYYSEELQKLSSQKYWN